MVSDAATYAHQFAIGLVEPEAALGGVGCVVGSYSVHTSTVRLGEAGMIAVASIRTERATAAKPATAGLVELDEKNMILVSFNV